MKPQPLFRGRRLAWTGLVLVGALAGLADPRPGARPATEPEGAKEGPASKDLLLRPGGLGGRSGKLKDQLLEAYGGNAVSEAAVARGLKWLAQHQSPDGHWSLDDFQHAGGCNCTGKGRKNDIAGTGFGLLPLLAAGHTHRAKAEEDPYARNIENGLKYLVAKQQPDGYFGGSMYAHALVTMALCEAYGMTSDAALKTPARRAIDLIVKSQNPEGGWRYEPDLKTSDTSVVGWQVAALERGQLAGLEVPERTWAGARKWLDAASTPDHSRYGYIKGSEPTPTLTAVGLLSRMYLGWGPRRVEVRKGAVQVRAIPPRAINDTYYYYYATQLLYQVGGDDWEVWNPKMRDWLTETQDRGADPQHAHQRGSWDPKGDQWGNQGGRLMQTSLSLLTLEVYYRYLPLSRRLPAGGG